MKIYSNYYLGLDIGTDSVGYAVTNEDYALLKYKGEPMWGVHLFEAASLNAERRRFRTARRRIDRRQQRVKLIQEIFGKEIAKVDVNFYRRIKESALWREDAHDSNCLFDDSDYKDVDYHRQYPTIHHLICELMNNKEPHDVRLVYLACAWLVAHRGHFLSDVSKENLSDVLDIRISYFRLMEWFAESSPWHCNPEAFGDILKKKLNINAKYRMLCQLLFNASKAPKREFPEDEKYYSTEHVLKLLCGGKVAAKDLFGMEEYAEIESFSLDEADDTLAAKMGALGDDADLISRLKALYDWAILSEILMGTKYISEKKVSIYKQHGEDLHLLKSMIRKYKPDTYNDVFRDEIKQGYAFYIKTGKREEFCKYVKAIVKSIIPEQCDALSVEELIKKLEACSLCPMQVTTDNRVIPYQVYWVELKKILDNASEYLPFLQEADSDGYIVCDKIMAVMEFRIPYFVGPLNRASKYAWFCRKEGITGRIYPWNFEEKVDLDSSEKAFIDRMTNTCTYLPYADVMPKCSLLHEKFQVLNEINTLTVHGKRIPVELKQRIFDDLFTEKKRITKKSIKSYLLRNGFYNDSDLETLGGIDDTVKSSLSSFIAFKRLLKSRQLSESDAEEIIRRSTYTEDRIRFTKWIDLTYPQLSDDDRRYISKLRFNDFARLSRELLQGIGGMRYNDETGELCSVIERMWNENVNLMELLSDRYTYREKIAEENEIYYADNPKSMDERMNDMYLSNSVKRSIIRTMDIVGDVKKVTGCAPKKIFVEMARGDVPERKGKRTKSRYQQLMELYAKCELEDARDMEARLNSMGEDRDNRLQGEKLFLYYLQLGRSMYSGKVIDFDFLFDKRYDIDHIYPQSKVKDDSILNNKVLVLSEENGIKGDKYPVSGEIRRKMYAWWKLLLDHGFITEEKFKRLTRHTPFDENEEWSFINRQLVETRQSTKAVATLLKEQFPNTEIVYVKAGMVAEFRQEFDMLKSRAVNDLHHAKDAYLNIVVGNVYSEQFTRSWFMKNRSAYNLKVSTLFSRKICINDRVIWNGGESIGKVKKVIHEKNSIHLTRYSFCRKGGLFNQQPESAGEGLVPRKTNLPSVKYGGYNNKSAMAFILARFTVKQKRELMLVVIDLISSNMLTDELSTKQYVRSQIEEILGKTISDLELPLGSRLLKMHTMFEADGIRMTLASKSSKGRKVVFSIIMPLLVGYKNERYIKRLERYYEKKKEYPTIKYSPKYDGITIAENIELYNILTNKLCDSVIKYRPANPSETVCKGGVAFEGLDIDNQVKLLLQLISTFSRNTSGCDLSAINGKAQAAVPTLNSQISNWKKKYKDVRIIDQSASGLFESRSMNLLELL